jgi:Tfp pilus assembly protein PilF
MLPNIVLALCLLACAAAGTLVLHDGSTVSGELRRGNGGYHVVAENGSRQFVADTDIQTVRLGGSGESVESGLDSLRRVAANLDDLDEIIRRYEAFVEEHDDAAARGELEAFRRMRAENFVHWGNRWVSPAEQRELAAATLEAVNDVRLKIKAGDVPGAKRAVIERLRADNDDVSALYLMAVLAWEDGDVAETRRRLERVAELAPDHAPTANNLAVVLLRQNQEARALLFLDRALAAAPGTKQLLDNAAEALQLAPGESRPYAALAERFAAQDQALQQRLAAEGWYRDGATWIDQATQTEREQQRAEAAAQIERLRTDYDATTARIAALQGEVRQTREAMQEIKNNTVYRDTEGRLRQRPVPDIYFELERDVLTQERQIAEQQARLTAINTAAAEVEALVPGPTYTGVLQFIDEDGVPVPLPLPLPLPE